MSKTVSKIIAVTAALVLAFAFMITGAFLQFGSASSVNAAATEIVDAKIVDRVAYGSDITVPDGTNATVTVKTPGGTEVEPVGGKVKATEVGVYEITYAANDESHGKYANYTYGVECYMEYDYELIVDNSKVVVPTYRKIGDAFELPTATLYYNDEDENALLPVRAADGGNAVFAKVTAPDGTVSTFGKADLDAGKSITPDKGGMYFITYYAKVGGGDNIESVDYTVQVQNNFEDTKDPTMTINGINQSGSTNAKFDVQPATVSDNFDGNRVVMEISVKHTYGETEYDVPEVVVDKSTGYAAKDANGASLFYKKGENERYAYDADGNRQTTTNISEAVPARFDNGKFMSFYPTEDGAYKLSYRAIDSTGNGEGVAPQTFTLTVGDYTVPVVKSFDQSLIPSRWGLRVFKQDPEDASGTVEVEDTNIMFPIPELIDNNGDANLGVSFTLTRSQNTKTFVSFSNIYATEPSDRSRVSGSTSFGGTENTYYFFRYWLSKDYNKGADGFTVSETDGKITGKWTVNGTLEAVPDNTYSFVYYSDAAEKVTKGFFNFAMIKDSNNTGTYTVRYNRTDGKNSQSSSYSIELQSSFTDSGIPTVDFKTPDYLVFRDYKTTQSITDVRASDSEDARLGTEYYIIFNQSLNAKDGDDLKFDENITDEKIAGWLDGGNAIELGTSAGSNVLTLEVKNGEFTVTADDVNGDEQTAKVNKGSTVYVALRATDSVGQSDYKVTAVEVIDGTTEGSNYKPVFTEQGLNTAEGNIGKEYNFGSFSIDYGDAQNRNYVGFELYVKRVQDADGKAVNDRDETVAFETYSDNGSGSTHSLHVDNIRFTPNTSGTYMLVVRGFHVSGKSSVQLAFMTVASNGGTDTGVATALPDEIDCNKTYYLESEYTTQLTGDKIGILRSIKGGRCSLMGNEFVAKDNVSYYFSDYAFIYNEATKADATDNSLISYNYTDGSTGVYAGKSLSATNLMENEYESVATMFDAKAADNSEATFRVVGDTMPAYTPISSGDNRAFVKLPNVSASSATGNATEITVTVTDPNGSRVETTKVGDVLPAGYDGGALVGNEFLFEAKVDGKYTVVYTAVMANGKTASATYTIKAGDVVAPVFDINYIGSINGKNIAKDSSATVNVNDTFGFAEIKLDSSETSSTCTYSKVLYNPAGDAVATVNHATRPYSGTEPYTFTQAGTYRVVYSVTDAAGNVSTIDRYITVVGKNQISSSSTATLAIVLIIVGVLIIAGVIIYIIRFRKRKSKDNK